MYKKYLNCYNVLITGLLTLVLGILVIVLSEKFLVLIIYLVSMILMVYAVSNIIKLITKRYDNHKTRGIIFQIILNITLSIVLLFSSRIPLPVFSLIFGLYILINSVIKLVNYIIFKMNHIHGRLIELSVFIFYIIFGLSFIFLPMINMHTILLIIGIYFIILGLTYISDFIAQIMPNHQKKKFRRRFKLTLPVFISALIPHNTLNKINKSSDAEAYIPKKIFKNDKEEKADLEILIHVTKKGYGMVGHADIYFENKIMSYANYDHDSYKLFGSIGDGLLCIADDKEKYIKFCIDDSKKTIFVFGIKLTKEQKNTIKKYIAELMENTYEWTSFKRKEYEKHNYYATRLYKVVKPTYYKFNKGKFKTYFVLNNNCVKLVDYILGATGINFLKTDGIITPGVYYDFLATEYTKKNSNVISYKIYK